MKVIKDMRERYFIVFYRFKKNNVNGNGMQSVVSEGYINHSITTTKITFEQKVDYICITGIIELNRDDYKDFVK